MRFSIGRDFSKIIVLNKNITYLDLNTYRSLCCSIDLNKAMRHLTIGFGNPNRPFILPPHLKLLELTSGHIHKSVLEHTTNHLHIGINSNNQYIVDDLPNSVTRVVLSKSSNVRTNNIPNNAKLVSVKKSNYGWDHLIPREFLE